MTVSRTTPSAEKGRLRAVFLCLGLGFLVLALGGCAHSGKHPLLATVGAFLPGQTDVSDVAADVSYASINFSLGRRNGLLVLSEQKSGLTFWQSSQSATIVLQHGYLQSTAGLQSNLAMTRLSGFGEDESADIPWKKALVSPVHYKVLRTWETADGRLKSGSAQADTSCASGVEKVELPLAKLPLKQCHEVLTWASGQTTRSTYWIDPKDGRIWAADTVPWPGADAFDWQVARPWWS